MTYPTYQAAKIANPDSEVYKFIEVTNDDKIFFHSGCDLPERLTSELKPCNPADYCMTVKQFLDAGHNFVEGDIVMPEERDDERCILKAKALEETKTYRYEKATDYIFDLKEEFERGELFSFDGNEHYVQIETEGDFSYAHVHENIYRRIEVTERELELEAAYDLYLTKNTFNAQSNLLNFNDFKMTGEYKLWLLVVHKTGYRKPLNNVNGKG